MASQAKREREDSAMWFCNFLMVYAAIMTLVALERGWFRKWMK
jgi:hypothetical protein